jgi:polyketide synthase PksJ
MYKFRTGPDATDSAPPAADEATSESHAIAGHEAYWTSALERLEPALLPATRKENPGRDRSPQYAGLSLAIPDEIWNILADSSMEPAEVLQAAFIAHVARIGGRHSFDIGYSDAHLAAIVAATPGVYAPIVPMSLTVSPDRAFAGLVAEVARARGAATQHLTFALNLRTRHPGLPEEAQSAVDRIARTAVQVVSDIRTYEPTPGGELTLVVAPGSTAFVLRYDRQVFDNERIQRMAAHLLTLIGSAAREPLRPVSELTLVSGHERHRLLEQWNDTRIEYPHDRTVTTLFEAQAAATPDATAVTDGQTSQSYAQLNAQANRVARHLRRHGVTPGMVVGICMDRSPAMIVALLGILKAGGAYVPLDPAFPADRLAFMVTDSRAPLLVTQKPLEAMLPSHAAKVVLLDLHGPQIAEEDETNPEWTVDTSGLAYVLYTSGSTGTPKGVEIPHRALTNFLCSMQVSPGFGAGDSLLALTTLSFDIAGLELYLPLISGGRVELASREVAMDPRQLAARIEQCRPTMMQATPSTWQMLLESGWNGSRALVALCGGEALPRQLADKLVARTSALWNMYGPTETTVWSSIHRVRATDEEISIGRPIANTGLYILDPHLQLSPIGASGELFIDGDGLALGYRNRPDLTADRFIAHPFSTSPGARLYRTGDLARYREDGSSCIWGDWTSGQGAGLSNRARGDRGGACRPPVRSPGRGHSARRRLRRHQPGCLCCTSRRRITVASDLRAHLQASLPDYMIPQYFVTLPAMPLTPNGKIDRKRLPTPERSRPLLPVDFEPASNTTQSDLAAIWESVLAVRPVGIDDNFFELGGTSLLAVRMLERIERSLGFRISIGRAFASPTVRGLEALLKDPLPARSSLRAGQGSGSEDIAIVGMAGRFPGCRDTREYWQAISEGRELITFFEEAEIDPSIDRESLRQPNYVKARGVIDEADCFDAAFFGMNPKEADVIDPQQRVLLEVAWHALEDAGIHGAALEQQRVAVFAGSRRERLLPAQPAGQPGREGSRGIQVADRQREGLRGHPHRLRHRPSRSGGERADSLLHIAGGRQHGNAEPAGGRQRSRSLRRRLDPGSAEQRSRVQRGKRLQPGRPLPPLRRRRERHRFQFGCRDGRAHARELAIAEGRRIYAILKGSGVNNDGGGKMSFMAPSVEGQARVLAQALDGRGHRCSRSHLHRRSRDRYAAGRSDRGRGAGDRVR